MYEKVVSSPDGERDAEEECNAKGKQIEDGLAVGLLTVLVTFNTAVSWGQAEIDADHYENTNDGPAPAVQPSSRANRDSGDSRVPSARIRPQQTCARTLILWNNTAIEAARDNNSGSLMMLRALAVMHTAMFDALARYNSGAHPTIGAAVRPPESDCTTKNKRKAISYAALRVLADLFPSSTAKLDHLMTTFGFDPRFASQDPATPSAIGLNAGAEVLDYWHSDGANQLGDLHPGPYSDYIGNGTASATGSLEPPRK